MKAKGHT